MTVESCVESGRGRSGFGSTRADAETGRSQGGRADALKVKEACQ